MINFDFEFLQQNVKQIGIKYAFKITEKIQIRIFYYFYFFKKSIILLLKVKIFKEKLFRFL